MHATTTASAGTENCVTTYTNAETDADDWIGIITDSVSGDNDRLHITFSYKVNP